MLSSLHLPGDQRPRNSQEQYDYDRDSAQLLAASATLRRLTATYESGSRTHLFDRNTIAQGLRRNDESAPFRFFALPPELRNLVYENLLLFEGNSLKCQPQILATCKRVHSEATNILYGMNTITINIYQDRVEAHGIKCGSYIPLERCDSKPGDPPNRMSAIQWPDFLRRARSIVIRPSQIWGSDYDYMEAVTDRRRRRAIHNVVYSFCSTLSTGHKICKIVMAQEDLTASERLVTEYPLRLLGVDWYSTPDETKQMRKIYLYDSNAYHQAVLLQNGIFAPKTRLICKIIALLTKMHTSYLHSTWWRLNVQMRYYRVLVYGLAFKHAVGLISASIVEWHLKHYVACLRECYVSRFMDGQPELLEEMSAVLMLEVELRAPRSGAVSIGGN